jgi:hypothetical protein
VDIENAFRALEKIPDEAFNRRTLTFVENLVRNPDTASFIIRHGWEPVEKMLVRASRKMDRVNGYIKAIDRMVGAEPVADKAAEIERVVQRIIEDDAATWQKIVQFFPENAVNKGWRAGELGRPTSAQIQAAADIKAFKAITEGMAPGARGAEFEKWMWPHLKRAFNLGENVKQERVIVEMEKNAELLEWVDDWYLEEFEGRTRFITDGFVREGDGLYVFDGKGLFVGEGTVPSLQVQAYEAMRLRGQGLVAKVGDAAEAPVRVKNFVYVFPDYASAERNIIKVLGREGEIWFFDDAGVLTKLE